MRKAQLTIEYMIILVIMLLLFNAITLDLVNTSLDDANFFQTAEMVNSSRLAVADAIKIVFLQGSGAKKTINLRAPPDCDYVQTLSMIVLECTPNSASSNSGFSGELITPSVIPAEVSVAVSGGVIASGDLGTVTFSKE